MKRKHTLVAACFALLWAIAASKGSDPASQVHPRHTPGLLPPTNLALAQLWSRTLFTAIRILIHATDCLDGALQSKRLDGQHAQEALSSWQLDARQLLDLGGDAVASTLTSYFNNTELVRPCRVMLSMLCVTFWQPLLVTSQRLEWTYPITQKASSPFNACEHLTF